MSTPRRRVRPTIRLGVDIILTLRLGVDIVVLTIYILFRLGVDKVVATRIQKQHPLLKKALPAKLGGGHSVSGEVTERHIFTLCTGTGILVVVLSLSRLTPVPVGMKICHATAGASLLLGVGVGRSLKSMGV